MWVKCNPFSPEEHRHVRGPANAGLSYGAPVPRVFDWEGY